MRMMKFSAIKIFLGPQKKVSASSGNSSKGKWLKFIRFSLRQRWPYQVTGWVSGRHSRASNVIIRRIIIHDMQKTLLSLFITLFPYPRQVIDWWQPRRRVDYLQFRMFLREKCSGIDVITPKRRQIDNGKTTRHRQIFWYFEALLFSRLIGTGYLDGMNLNVTDDYWGKLGELARVLV